MLLLIYTIIALFLLYLALKLVFFVLGVCFRVLGAVFGTGIIQEYFRDVGPVFAWILKVSAVTLLAAAAYELVVVGAMGVN